MNHYPIWFDCDTGVDDAIALMYAHANPQINIIGISAVCGNAELEKTYLNTKIICTLMGAAYPVYRGAEKPLYRELHVGTMFHGENGLGNVALPAPDADAFPTERAWDALYRAAKAHSGTLRVIATAPLTDLAIALIKYPDLPSLLHSILIMGGSTSVGNVTPAAEFNIYADPESAKIVFSSGVPIVMCGLDVTLKATLRPGDWDELAASGRPCGVFVKDCLQHAWKTVKTLGFDGVPMHDACPVMYLTHPELFTAEPAGVAVETKSRLTLGKTVTDLYSDKQFEKKNATVVLDVDRDKMIALLKQAIISI